MPKGKTPSLIGSSNGRPRKVAVERKSECNRCGCQILAGQECFGIPKAGSFMSLKRYCRNCFDSILEQTRKDLEDVEKLRMKSSDI